MRPRSALAFLVAGVALLALALPAAPPAAAADQCFPETGKCIVGAFAAYWQEHGGLAQQGYPISDAFAEVNPTDGKTYTVQYFERARFELHPENPAPYNVLLGLIGREQFAAKYPAGRPAGGTGDVCFDVTGRCVRGVFYAYWQQHGGLAQQGYPISDEFDEVNPADGKTYRVQYFERARFEEHPEYAGTDAEVLLGLLGREQFLAKYPGGQPGGATAPPSPSSAPSPSPSPTPAPAPPIPSGWQLWRGLPLPGYVQLISQRPSRRPDSSNSADPLICYEGDFAHSLDGSVRDILEPQIGAAWLQIPLVAKPRPLYFTDYFGLDRWVTIFWGKSYITIWDCPR